MFGFSGRRLWEITIFVRLSEFLCSSVAADFLVADWRNSDSNQCNVCKEEQLFHRAMAMLNVFPSDNHFVVIPATYTHHTHGCACAWKVSKSSRAIEHLFGQQWQRRFNQPLQYWPFNFVPNLSWCDAEHRLPDENSVIDTWKSIAVNLLRQWLMQWQTEHKPLMSALKSSGSWIDTFIKHLPN